MRQRGVTRRELLRVGGVMGLGSFVLTVSPAALAQQKSKAKPSPSAPRPVIVLDPGHGGVDPGAVGWSGIFEKDIAFDATRELARQLEATRRYRIALTRTGDEFVPLRERVNRARAAEGDLFLSIHADALPNNQVRGASIYTLSEEASDVEAAALAARENKADLIAGIDLSRHAPEVGSILLDLAMRQTKNMSIGLAKRLVAELGRDVRLLHNGHRSAGFAVLKAPDIPSALVELGCLSNRDEDRLLRSSAYQAKLANGIVRSVNTYFESIAKA